MKHTDTQLFQFRKDDGKMLGTQGWRAEHESSECTVHTGLWRGNKVVALLVAKGDYDGIADELKAEGEFLIKAVNSHDALVAALDRFLRAWESDSDGSGAADEARTALADALAKST